VASCAFTGSQAITAPQIERLEQQLDGFNDPLPPLKDFILPGGGPMSAACHVSANGRATR
jgi:cob(I)alamin adenosyltransferase